MCRVILLAFFCIVISSALEFNSFQQESKVNKLMLNVVYSVIQAENLAGCTFIRVTGEGVNSDTFSGYTGLEYTLFKNPQILIHLSSPTANSSLSLTKMEYMKSQHTESCSFTWYFVGLDQWKLFDIDFVNSVPGGIFGSYHLVFTDRPSKGYFKNNVPLVMIQMHNLIVVTKQPMSASFEIFTPNVWYNDSLSLATYRRGWYDDNIQIFRTKWANYGDGPLTVATTPDVTPLSLEEFSRSKRRKKYIVQSSVDFARYLNTTCRVLPVRPGIYGYKAKNGKWYGIIAEVWKGNAQFSCPTTMTKERTEIMTYTQLYAFDQVIFITGLPREANLSGSLTFLVYPLSFTVWIFVILSLFLIYSTLLVKKILDNTITPNLASYKQRIHSKYFSLSILNVILRPTLDQSGDTPNLIKKVLKDRLSRFIFATWLLALIVLSSGYKSKVISALLTPDIVTPPRTFEELVHSNYKLGAVLYNESFFGESFRNLDNEIGRQVTSRVKGFPNIAGPECYLLTERTLHACIGLGAYLTSLANVFLTDSSGQSLYKVSTNGLFPFGVGSSVPRRFPHLKAPLQRVSERLQAQGVLQYWVEEEKYWSKIKGQRLSNKFRKKADITVKKDSGVWQLLIIVLVGHALAFVIFVLENIHWLIQKYLQRRFQPVKMLR